MKKFNLFNKVKQLIKGRDRNFLLLIFCVISIILMCCCIIRHIVEYKCDCNRISTQIEQRLDRCEELLNQLNENYTYLEGVLNEH